MALDSYIQRRPAKAAAARAEGSTGTTLPGDMHLSHKCAEAKDASRTAARSHYDRPLA